MPELTLEAIQNHPYVLEQVRINKELSKTIESLRAKLSEVEAQVSWFQKQLFGSKSERRTAEVMPATQLLLFELPTMPQPAEALKVVVPGHERKKSQKVTSIDNAGETGLRFGPEVKVVEIEVANPAVAGLKEEEYEIISYVVKEQLCQEKSSYFVKRYKQPVIKVKSSLRIVEPPPAVESVINSHYADVSLLVGMVTDKFMYHLPLYRQHQRMQSQGVSISRGSLTNWVHDFIDLFKPIYDAQESSVLGSKVLSIDETPHKAGRRNRGTSKGMSECYYWFFYGDQDEVYIHNSPSRGSDVIREKLTGAFTGTVLSDGYVVYDSICKQLSLLHASCWAHVRRYFVEAEEQEPLASQKAVSLIRLLYEKESQAPPELDARLKYRLTEEKPILEELFDWLKADMARVSVLPKTSYSKAVNYALEREASLMVYLTNPSVPIDNNHVERSIRPLVLGRKNYLFCWSELGADKVALIQSLILTCQLHDVDPHEYLTDCAARIQTHPNSRVQDLTPRLWKNLFSKKITNLATQKIPLLAAA